MAVFTVHVPTAVGDRIAAAESAVFVPEAFSWGAFLFGPLWFVLHRAWIGLAVNLVAILAIVASTLVLHPQRAILVAVVVLLALFLGCEARQLMRLGLEIGGYRAADVVVARDGRAAEHAFFLRWLAQESPAKPRNQPPTRSDDDIIGLFPHPEGQG